ncbi:MAG: hypothetical protein ACOYUZ_01070 [Patescibacteria group bacterium]
MNLVNRRNIAIVLILIGLAALIFGLWILIGLFWPQSQDDLNLPEADRSLTLQESRPQIFELETAITGTSTFDEKVLGSDETEAVNRANSVVARMGSGSSHNGFMGYSDVMIDGTPRFQNFLKEQQLNMQRVYPPDGDVFGFTTRIVSSSVVEGGNGADKIAVKIQAQVADDKGDKFNPVNVRYEEHLVTLLRQSDGKFLVDYIESKQLN